MPKPYIRQTGYSTDALIKGSSDAALLKHMGVPQRYWAQAITKKQLPNRIEGWIENLRYVFRPALEAQTEQPDLCGKGLVLYGPPTTGKTITAAATLLKVIRMGVINSDPSGDNYTWHGWCMGRFIDWQDYSDILRRGFSDESSAHLSSEQSSAMWPTGPMTSRGDFLVLDDLSRERRTEFNVGELQRIIRHRHNHGYPTIITTNHLPREWEDVYGDVLAGFLHRAFIEVGFTA